VLPSAQAGLGFGHQCRVQHRRPGGFRGPGTRHAAPIAGIDLPRREIELPQGTHHTHCGTKTPRTATRKEIIRSTIRLITATIIPRQAREFWAPTFRENSTTSGKSQQTRVCAASFDRRAREQRAHPSKSDRRAIGAAMANPHVCHLESDLTPRRESPYESEITEIGITRLYQRTGPWIGGIRRCGRDWRRGPPVHGPGPCRWRCAAGPARR